MNVMNQVELVLELTKLDHVFEFCSVEDMFNLLCPGLVKQRSDDQANQQLLTRNCDSSFGRQEIPGVQRNRPVPAATV